MDILKELLKITSEKNVFADEPLKKHTSFRIGGKADFLVVPENTDEIQKLLSFLKENHIKYIVIGNGSNLLVSDEGFRGVVVKLGGGINNISCDGEVLYVEAGVLMSKISSFCLQNSLDGFSELSGIPGTFGGAVYMNAGAYGKEIKDLLLDVTFINSNGEIETIDAEAAELSYRHSVFSDTDCVVLCGHLKLEYGDKAEILSKTREITKKRNDKQPINYPSAGSTFKRPEGYFAAKLIEDCGFKGLKCGGAMVSEKHSGFVINYDNATFNDVVSLTEKIKQGVKEKTGVELELEVKIIGG